MPRIASAVLVGGVLLMFVWAAAPAAPTPTTLPPSAVELAAIDAAAPLAQDVAREAARLRQHLDQPPGPPQTARDPFKFGAPPSHATPKGPEPTSAPGPSAQPSAPALPVLVAIVGNGDARRAAFAVGDDVEVVATGEAVGRLTVHAIAADHVDLIDADGKLVTIPLK